MRCVWGQVDAAEVSVGQQNVNDQLQIGLPSNGLPEENHSCLKTWEGFTADNSGDVANNRHVLTFDLRQVGDGIRLK